MASIYWHDYETTGTDPAWDRPIQFAGIRTDEELNILGEPLVLYCKPSRDILPHPRACLITGITPQHAEREGVPEPEFIRRIYEEIAAPGTCGAGYNSLRFDDEVTRHTLYRNFYDPYEREWRNGNSRWDIIDMLRLARALRPDGIAWPTRDDGSPSFRLEELTAANGIGHENAHDALSDVMATIAMARLVREHQPKLYQYVYETRVKHRVAALVDPVGRRPFLHVSGRLPRENGYTALMIPLCQHPTNKNGILAFNLMSDPVPLLQLDAEAIRERVFTRGEDLDEGVERLALKTVHINRCPVVATPKLMDAAVAQRLGIDVARCERHWEMLKNADIGDKLARVFGESERSGERDAELSLYGGFLPDADRPLLAAVRAADAAELATGSFPFTDRRYRELLLRYKGRHYPQALSEDERCQWLEFRERRLSEPGPGRMGLEAYFDELDALEATCDSERDRHIIAALREWGDELVASE
ncbi:MAG TPA: exodeoxyribonuclease I [Porticoccaceae bacterium]